MAQPLAGLADASALKMPRSGHPACPITTQLHASRYILVLGSNMKRGRRNEVSMLQGTPAVSGGVRALLRRRAARLAGKVRLGCMSSHALPFRRCMHQTVLPHACRGSLQSSIA